MGSRARFRKPEKAVLDSLATDARFRFCDLPRNGQVTGPNCRWIQDQKKIVGGLYFYLLLRKGRNVHVFFPDASSNKTYISEFKS